MNRRTLKTEKLLSSSPFPKISSSVSDSCSRFATDLEGPVAILFISRDTCIYSIAKLFRACFCGYRTIIARYVAKWGIAQKCLYETKYQGGVSHHFGGVLTSLKKVSCDMGYCSDSIAISRNMGPLRPRIKSIVDSYAVTLPSEFPCWPECQMHCWVQCS